jgi:DtxR family transcriptional regulator, Mn-dependent transcriptional regulator
MNSRADHERDECLERLWHRRELGIGAESDAADAAASDAGAAGPGAADRMGDQCITALAAEGLVESGPDGSFRFSPEGERRARQLVRSHRLAERLVQDVLGQSAEPSACEFEHLLGTEVVDAICTLLGHPRECPHGYPIPPGACCERLDRVAPRQVKPLAELDIGASGRIAWVYAGSDRQLHALDSLQLRPGAMVTLHQRRPTFVVECEGAHVALDDDLARAVNVWAADASEDSHASGHGSAHRGRHRWRTGPERRSS